MADIEATVNFEFLLDLTDDIEYVVLEGSTRSSKTISIIQFLILEAVENPDTIIRCFRHDGSTHNSTTIPSFMFCMGHEMFNLWDTAGSFNKSEKIYSFSNGSKICFDATNEPMKLHGKESDIAWFNEVMEITWDAYTQIAYRCKDLKIFDFNPSLNQHWVFDKILSREIGVAYRHSTYLDNPFLTDKQVAAIESYNPNDPVNIRNNTADQWAWDVYGLGKRGKIEGQIFKTYQITEEWPERYVCQKWGFGLDFGFSADPMALAEYRLYNNKLYVRELVYETDLIVSKNVSKPNVPSLEHRFEQLGIDRNMEIVADCARPDSIRELQISGYNVIPCEKGKDSVMAGINLLRGFMIMIHRDSNNFQMEAEQYSWKQKQDGTWLQEPKDEYNHLWDGARYWAMRNLSSPKKYMSQKPGRQIKVHSRVRSRVIR